LEVRNRRQKERTFPWLPDFKMDPQRYLRFVGRPPAGYLARSAFHFFASSGLFVAV
jgi:hypothetical protein